MDVPWDVLGDDVALPGPLAGSAAPVWLLVVWVILLGTVVQFSLITVALGQLGSARTGLIGMAEPVLAGLVAWVVLRRRCPVRSCSEVSSSSGIVLAETARRRSTGAQGQLPEGIAP